MGEKLASFLVRRCRILLVFAVLWGVGSVPLSRQLDLDWKVESMFPAGDPLVDAYRRLEDRFGSNDICLAVYRDPELWSEDGRGLRRLGTVSNRLRQIDGVQSVVSLAELATVMQSLRQPLGALSAMAPAVGTQQDAEAPALLDENDPLAVALLGVFEGYTHRRGNDYVTIACLLKPSEADQAVERGPSNHQVTLGELRRAMADLPSPAADGLVTGEPVLVAEGFRMVERDGRILGLASAGLVALVLLISFRSVRWTLIPLAVVLWALWTTQAVLVLLRLELTMISSTLAALVTVIGVATSMHLLLNFQNGRRQGKSREDALRSALSVLMAPIFWACVTDAIAFIALQYASVGPVQDFGLMMAVASLAVLVAIIVLVPGMALIGKWDPDPSTPKVDLLIRHALRQLLDWISQYRRPGIAAAGLVMAFGAIGCFFLRVETDFTKNFHRSSPIVQGYTVVEKQLGGAGVWDVMLPAPASLSRDYADSVVELSDRLRAIEVDSDGHVARLTKVLSIVDAADAVEEDPWLKLTPFALRLQAMRGAMPEFSRALLSETPEDGSVRWIRIMLRSEESVGAAAKAELITCVQRELDTFTSSSQWARHFAATSPPAEVAGYHVMLSKLVSNVLRDQWFCLLLATLGIWCCISVALRSVTLGLIGLVPNFLPVVLVLGVMGWSGMRANMGAAMIAAVSLGLSVDSTIHYLSHWRRRLQQGSNSVKALRSAQETVGLAALLSTAALIAGFLCLCVSEFVPTVVFGVLASLTLLGGLVGNLFVLPLLIPRQLRR